MAEIWVSAMSEKRYGTCEKLIGKLKNALVDMKDIWKTYVWEIMVKTLSEIRGTRYYSMRYESCIHWNRVVTGRVLFWPVPVLVEPGQTERNRPIDWHESLFYFLALWHSNQPMDESYFSPNHYSYDIKIPFHYYNAFNDFFSCFLFLDIYWWTENFIQL